jgi:hypothetical protein
MSLAKKILEKNSSDVRESKSSASIKALIDTNFSADDKEKGKAAELLKGLFYSKDSEAVEFVKNLDAMLSKMKPDMSEEEVDFEKANLQSLWSFISKKIDRKAPVKQTELLMPLIKGLFELVQELPSGENHLRKLLKKFRSEM